jgi:hypothetical protein
MVKTLAIECVGPAIANMPLPVYFVDSPEWQGDSDLVTHHELERLHDFATRLQPLSTKHLPTPNPAWYKVEKQTRKQVQTNKREDPLPNGAVRTLTYQDQERERRTAYDGHTITYSEWQKTREWKERQTLTRETETVTEEIGCEKTPRIEQKKGSRIFFGWFGPRERWQEEVGQDFHRRFRTKERVKTTGFDGQISYGSWKSIREWAEDEFVKKGERPRANYIGTNGPVHVQQVQVNPLGTVHFRR